MAESPAKLTNVPAVQILHVRGQRVRRNAGRFPADFLLELSDQELAASRSPIATLNKGRGHNLKYRFRLRRSTLTLAGNSTRCTRQSSA